MEKDPTKRLGYRGADEVLKHPFFSGIGVAHVLNRKVSLFFNLQSNPPSLHEEVEDRDVSNFDELYTSLPPLVMAVCEDSDLRKINECKEQFEDLK